MTARRAHNGLSETEIQRAVFQHVGWRAYKDTFIFHPANGGYRTATEGAIFASLGVVPGTPDIIAIYRGRVFALELKTETGRVSQAQLECHEELRRAGATVDVAYGLDHALRQLEQWQLLKHNAASRDERFNRERPTPQATIEAIMHSVRERGLGALHEPANIERLVRCDQAAKERIDRRIAKLVAEGRVS
jgi:hypothetical protein